jgi:Ser/Thr protein kinase RdoA (MazF antagonist)
LVDGFGSPEPDCKRIAVDGAREFHEAACDYLRTRRKHIEPFGHADTVTTVLDTLRDHPDCFAGAGESVLCHGWWTPEHVAVANSRVVCALDFEHAFAAPAAFDYWRAVVPRPDMDEERTAAFRAGYESVRPLPDDIETRRPFYLLLILAYYFESLYVQDQHSPAATEQKAAALRERILEVVAAVG